MISGKCPFISWSYLALALLYERRDECPGAVPILAVHDEVVVECGRERSAEAEAWLKRTMVDGMETVVNGPEVEGPRVPIDVEIQSGKAWLDG